MFSYRQNRRQDRCAISRSRTKAWPISEWADEDADDYGKRDALAILRGAVEATHDRDLRHDRDVLDALDWLTEQSGSRVTVIGTFRSALDEPHPVTRRYALAKAYRAICAAVTGIR